MRWLLAVGVILLAGCLQAAPDTSVLTIQLERSPSGAGGTHVLPSGAWASSAFVHVGQHGALEDLGALTSREQVPFDPGCTVGREGSHFHPDCTQFVKQDTYRIPRMSDEFLREQFYPLDSTGIVRVVLPEPMLIGFKLAGPASDDHERLNERNYPCGYHYHFEGKDIVSGAATHEELGYVHVSGDAVIKLYWMVAPASC